MPDIREGLEYNDDWRTFVTVKALFSHEECERVLGHRGTVQPGSVVEPERHQSYRDSAISWIHYGEDTAWLFRKLNPVITKANSRFYRFNLRGFTEGLQLSEYGPGQHYDWHIDIGVGQLSIRKMSFVLQLSDPADYDGGALQLAAGREPHTLPRDQGSIVIFPAFVLHRVTPVTRGLRRSLVGWIGGPPFT